MLNSIVTQYYVIICYTYPEIQYKCMCFDGTIENMNFYIFLS